MNAETMVLTQPSQIQMFRLLTLRSALKLEMLGMKRHGRSAFSLIKDELKKGGTRVQILNALDDHIRAFAQENGLSEPTLK